VSAIETEPCYPHTQLRKLYGAEFLIAKDMNISAPRLIVIRGTRKLTVVITRRDEYENGSQILKLLLQKLYSIRRDPVVLKEISRDQNEIN